MPENQVAGAGDPAGGAPDSDSMSSELPFEGFGAGNGGAGADPRVPMFAGANGARYKSMSPARLPITRSPCLTIPPGFSPTALLESPVLLTNIKAEPSPTTGTFYMHSVMKDTVGSDMLSSPRSISQISSYDEGRSSDFEFKPHIQSSSCSSFSSLGPLASTGPKLQEHLISGQAQQTHAQTLLSSQLVKTDNTFHSSHELTLSATASNPSAEMNSLEAGAPGEDASDELQERKDSDTGTLALPADHNGSSTYAAGEKSAEDGYNWRKYGQKHVKGSEFPRSYYKCTHPNCQMKKQLERSHDGQITEIIYKGKHDHPKPQPSRRLAVGTILSSQGEERFDGLSSLANAEAEKSLNAHGHVSHHIDSSGNPELSPSDDDIEVIGGRPNQNGDEVADDDDPEAKRRKMDTSATDVTLIGKTNREPRVVVQTVSEVDILDDGYRWRKYGQKVVKGNPNPRSYYKCTSVGCSVRKHVERASHDPKAVITTYEGKHNHDVPAARSTGHDSSAPMIPSSGNAHSSHVSVALSSMLRTSNTMATAHRFSHPQESNTISLDLGVGISPNHSTNTTNDKHQAPGTEQAQNCEMQQYVGHDCDQMVIQTAPMSNLYGSSSNDIYGSREDKGKDFSFGTPPIDHSSNLYYTTAGNLIMGP